MSGLRQAVDDYITVRRLLGFKLRDHPWYLHDFAAYLEAAGASTVTAELAVAWAKLPGPNAHPAYLGQRLSVVRGFARHLRAFDPATEVPSADLLHWRECRAVPYIYTDGDVAALMAAARSLSPRLRAATYEARVGLLKVTGARVGELINLDRADVDWDEGVLVLRWTKFNKCRELALHPSTAKALKAYAQVRDDLCPAPKSASFFVNTLGRRLSYVTVEGVFRHLARSAGLKSRSKSGLPRLHDVRHTFACTTLVSWYRAGLDVEAQMPLLSTWMGHTNPEKTFWYISAVPELLALAAQRREQAARSRP
ncbi:MAG TPA: tyrosine-type recombinase/integrase [Acidimicrobiales bacterium]|nr:tyrosine-type recombinase/integrase [Acidimicrobiales bacterium]